MDLGTLLYTQEDWEKHSKPLMHQRHAKYLLGCLVSGCFHPKVWLTAQTKLSVFFEGVWLQFPLYFTGRWSANQVQVRSVILNTITY